MKGIARLTNPLLYASTAIKDKKYGRLAGNEIKKHDRDRSFYLLSSFLGVPMILYISRQIRPVTRAVVVAMAGMILPAMALDLCVSSVGMV